MRQQCPDRSCACNNLDAESEGTGDREQGTGNRLQRTENRLCQGKNVSLQHVFTRAEEGMSTLNHRSSTRPGPTLSPLPCPLFPVTCPLFPVTCHLSGHPCSLSPIPCPLSPNPAPGRSRRSGLLFLPVPRKCAAAPEQCRSLPLVRASCSAGSSKPDGRPGSRFLPGWRRVRPGECD